MELPASVSLTKTQNLIKQIRQKVINNSEVTDVHWLLGSNIPSFYYNLTGGREQQNNFAQALIQLNSLASTSITKKLQSELDKTFPSARIIVRQLEQGPGDQFSLAPEFKSPKVSNFFKDIGCQLYTCPFQSQRLPKLCCNTYNFIDEFCICCVRNITMWCVIS